MSEYNFLKGNAFTFVMSRIPETTFRIVTAEVPGITVPPPDIDVPGVSQHFPGTYTQFEDFTFRFIVDEDLKNYEELYRWATQQRYAIKKDYTPKNDFEKNMMSDGILVTMTSASNPNREFLFKDMFPVALGPLAFDTTVDSPTPITCDATFKYSYFVLK